MEEENKLVKFYATLPLTVNLSHSKKFILNMNHYRNTHHFQLSSAKKNYANIVILCIPQLKSYPLKKIQITYTYFRPDRARRDLSNVLAVVDKFFCDVLVKKGVIIDDTAEHLPCVIFKDGGYEKNKGRVEAIVEEIL